MPKVRCERLRRQRSKRFAVRFSRHLRSFGHVMMAGANLRFRAVNDGKSPNFWQGIFHDFPTVLACSSSSDFPRFSEIFQDFPWTYTLKVWMLIFLIYIKQFDLFMATCSLLVLVTCCMHLRCANVRGPVPKVRCESLHAEIQGSLFPASSEEVMS